MSALRTVILTAAILLTLTTGCSSSRKNHSPMPTISEDIKADLEAPVNCSTAKHDIKILEEEKASTGKQVLSGVRAVFPIAAVAGLLMGDYNDRIQVATGQYNDDIDAQIAQIKRVCYIR